MKKYFFLQTTKHPCLDLALDANRIKTFYILNNWLETQNPAEADNVVLVGCAYNRHFTRDVLTTLESLKTNIKPHTRCMLTGCCTRINPEALPEIPNLEIISPLDIAYFDQIIDAKKSILSIPLHAVKISDFASNPTLLRLVKLKIILSRLSKCFKRPIIPRWLSSIPTSGWYFIRGVSNNTGACSISAPGNPKNLLISTPIEVIIQQIQIAIRKSAQVICLFGDDMGAWGIDIGWDLAELLTSILLISSKIKVCVRSIGFWYFMHFFDKISPIFKTGILKSISLTILSGSDRILSSLGQKYNYNDIENILCRLATLDYKPRVTVILVVGLPGETEIDFEKTRQIIYKLPFDGLEVIEYEETEMTKKIFAGEVISPDIKDRRARILWTDFILKKAFKLPPNIAMPISNLLGKR